MMAMDSVADDLIRRQVLREMRRALLRLLVAEAAEYHIMLIEVINGLLANDASPSLSRQFDLFMRTAGLPREEVLGLARQFQEGAKEDWDIEDLQVITDGFARQPFLLLTQADEIVRVAKRVAMTAKRREQQRPKLDALVRQARGIPEGEAL